MQNLRPPRRHTSPYSRHATAEPSDTFARRGLCLSDDVENTVIFADIVFENGRYLTPLRNDTPDLYRRFLLLGINGRRPTRRVHGTSRGRTTFRDNH